MKTFPNNKLLAIGCISFFIMMVDTNAQNLFVKLSSSRTATNSVNSVNPPSGYPYSAAAPFAGNFWNVITQSNNCPPGTTAPFDTNLYVNLPLVDSSNNVLSATMTVSYHLGTSTGTRNEPSTANGENVIQPGGVMQNAWRNFSTGNYATFTISNLTANGQYGLYIFGGTTTSGQGCQATNISGQAQTVSTTNNLANSNGAFGAIWTVSGGTTNLMPQGKTWNFTTCSASANGVFSFRYGVPSDSNFRFYNGFQLVPLSAPGVTGPTNQTIIAGNPATLTTSVSGFPTPTLQWLENGTNVVGATNTTLVLPNVQYNQNGFTYALVASNAVNLLTNSMTLTVIVTPSIADLTNQAAVAGSDIAINPTVGGVPTPTLQWQKDGTNLVGQTISSLMITNAQTGDSGQYCLIASNDAGVVTNCMTLTIGSDIAPAIAGLIDQTVVQGDTGTFTASVSGVPAPTLQWLENGTNIPGATGTSLILTNVLYSQNGYAYSLTASNSVGTATSNATLFVLVPPSISAQPQSLIVTDTQSAAFSVAASGVPVPSYQWSKNGSPIVNATNSTFTIASASSADMGTYTVIVSNIVSAVTSSNATLTVNSVMTTVSLTPSNSAAGICYDTPLYVTFDQRPLLRNVGKINIFSVTSTNPVDTLDMSLNAGNGTQSRTIAGETFNTYPVIITGSQAAIYPHLGVLTSNRTYYVTVDNGVFADTNGAYFVGITDTNAWRFSTKATGPANPTNIVVATDGSGDFATVQGAVDFAPSANTTPRLVNIRNGSYVEIVDVNGKNNLTFRGESRAGTVIGYANNANIAPGGSTHSRMAFKVNANDIAIDNLTVLNRTPKGGAQAEALMLETNIKRFILNNAEVDSYQDTILGNTTGTQAYFNNSLIQGDVDYIWGGMNMFATNCEIRSVTAGANITQARTDALSNGMAFVNCRITVLSNGVTGVTLGRAIGVASSTVAFVSCQLSSNITGWNAADIGTPSLGLRWWEFGNSNLTGTASLTFNGVPLTNGDINLACAQIVSCWLNGWTPQLAPNITGQPTNLTVNSGQSAAFSVSATGVPDPTYQWQKAGTNLIGQTSAILSIPSTTYDDGGMYSVIVSNSAGAVTSASATLTVIPTLLEAWQLSHFGCTSCPQAAPGADPDGDGFSNEAEFLAGTDPTSSASALRIISTASQGNDVIITWLTAGGRTNVVQASAGDGAGGFTTNFTDVSSAIIIPGIGDTTTNYSDLGGITNGPTRYYRVRLVP